jgi:hypothetical protein
LIFSAASFFVLALLFLIRDPSAACSLKSPQSLFSLLFLIFCLFSSVRSGFGKPGVPCDTLSDHAARHRSLELFPITKENAGFNAGWQMLMALQFGFSVTFFLQEPKSIDF